MASITSAKLSITHNHTDKTARPAVTVAIQFTAFEMSLMKQNPGANLFKLRCQLWGADSGLNGPDDYLWTYPSVHYFPDATQNSSETRTFVATVGEGVLDEDFGVDDIYAKVLLINLFTNQTIKKNSNEVQHSF